MSRYAKSPDDDLLALLQLAARRRTNPFAVIDAITELLARRVPPPRLGDAVLTFEGTLAGEVRDALDGLEGPTARFLQATVPADADGPRVEHAWQAAAQALTRLVRVDGKPKKHELTQLQRLSRDDVFLEGAQVALATADPSDVEANRWFLPLLVLDGGPASMDALLPHLDAALTKGGEALTVLQRLLPVAAKTPAMAAMVARLEAAAAR